MLKYIYIYTQIVINIKKNVGFVLAATFQGPLHGFYAPCPRAPSRCWHVRRSIYIILFHRTCTLLNPTVPEKKSLEPWGNPPFTECSKLETSMCAGFHKMVPQFVR